MSSTELANQSSEKALLSLLVSISFPTWIWQPIYRCDSNLFISHSWQLCIGSRGCEKARLQGRLSDWVKSEGWFSWFGMFLYVSVCFLLGFLCFLLWPLAAKLAAVMQCLQSCARQTFAVSIVYHQRWGSVEAVTHLLKSAGKGFVTDTVLRFCMLLGESRLQPFRAEVPDVVCHHDFVVSVSHSLIPRVR